MTGFAALNPMVRLVAMGMERAFGAFGGVGVLFPRVENPGCGGARLWRWFAGTGPVGAGGLALAR